MATTPTQQTRKLSQLPVIPTIQGGEYIVVLVNGQAQLAKASDLSANVVVDKAAIGLDRVDNTSDAEKPISMFQAQAFSTKVDTSTYTAFVSSTNAALASKATKAELQTLATTVASIDLSALNLKADKTALAALQAQVNAIPPPTPVPDLSAYATIDALVQLSTQTSASLNNKADKSFTDALSTQITNMATTLASVPATYATKVELSTGLAGKAPTTHTHDNYVTLTAFSQQMTTKADVSALSEFVTNLSLGSSLAGYLTVAAASQTYATKNDLSNGLATKAAINHTHPTYALASDMATYLAEKANQSDFLALQTTVAGIQAGGGGGTPVDLSAYLTTASAAATYATQVLLTTGLATKAATNHTHAEYALASALSSYVTQSVYTSGMATKASQADLDALAVVVAGLQDGGGTVDLTPYLTVNGAALVYMPQSGMSSYLTVASASSTYATQAQLTAWLATKADTSHTHAEYALVTTLSSYLTQASATTTYATQAALTAGLATKADTPHTHAEYALVTTLSSYLTQASATATYATQAALTAGLASKAALAHAHVSTDVSNFNAGVESALNTLTQAIPISADTTLTTVHANRTLYVNSTDPVTLVINEATGFAISDVVTIRQAGDGLVTLQPSGVTMINAPGVTARNTGGPGGTLTADYDGAKYVVLFNSH